MLMEILPNPYLLNLETMSLKIKNNNLGLVNPIWPCPGHYKLSWNLIQKTNDTAELHIPTAGLGGPVYGSRRIYAFVPSEMANLSLNIPK